MNVLQILVIFLLIAVLVWAVNRWVPLSAPWKNAFNILAIVLTAFWLLDVFLGINVMGLLRGALNTPVGR